MEFRDLVYICVRQTSGGLVTRDQENTRYQSLLLYIYGFSGHYWLWRWKLYCKRVNKNIYNIRVIVNIHMELIKLFLYLFILLVNESVKMTSCILRRCSILQVLEFELVNKSWKYESARVLLLMMTWLSVPIPELQWLLLSRNNFSSGGVANMVDPPQV